jgi:hypothetical protein
MTKMELVFSRDIGLFSLWGISVLPVLCTDYWHNVYDLCAFPCRLLLNIWNYQNKLVGPRVYLFVLCFTSSLKVALKSGILVKLKDDLVLISCVNLVWALSAKANFELINSLQGAKLSSYTKFENQKGIECLRLIKEKKLTLAVSWHNNFLHVHLWTKSHQSQSKFYILLNFKTIATSTSF